MTSRRILVGLSVVLISVVSITARAQGKLRPAIGPYKDSKTVLFVNSQDVFRIAKRLGLKVQMVKLSKGELKKLAKLPAGGCGCTEPMTDEASGCWTDCLHEWGIPSPMIWACAIACAGNLVACAACLGISEWILVGCAVYCHPPWNVSNKPGPLRHNLRHTTVGGQQAKLLLSPTRVALR